MKNFYTLVIASMSVAPLFAQNTFDQVHYILQTKCSNAGCHSAANGDALQFDGNATAVYNALIDVDPENANAKSRLDKLVKVNQPYESYLLRKINYDFDTDLALGAGEGDSMVDINGNALSKKETELIRQWIINGAKKTGKTVDTALVNSYYDNTYYPFMSKPVQPAAGAGKRVRCGPFFIPKSGSGQEFELCVKYHLALPYDAEVKKIDGFMNDESHHFLLFKFPTKSEADGQPNGVRVVSLTGGVTSFDGNKDLTAAWQDSEELDLPTGTALFWDKDTYLDLNYHVKNYGAQAVLPVDFYFNVYYEPRKTTTIEMKSKLVNKTTLFLGPGKSTQYHNDPDNGDNETRYIWMLNSHTHKFGTRFDLHEFDNSAPNKLGTQIYDGNFNYKGGYSFGQYYFDHPPIRYFNPQYPINYKTSGMRARADYDNTSGSLVTFGFTTNDEMLLWYYMYTNQLVGGSVGIDETATSVTQASVYPNPVNINSAIFVDVKEATDANIYLSDITGKKVADIFNGNMESGSNRFELPTSLSKGIYFANISSGGKVISRKFAITQ